MVTIATAFTLSQGAFGFIFLSSSLRSLGEITARVVGSLKSHRPPPQLF